MPRKASYDAPAARNAVKLLEFLCGSEQPLGGREIARHLDLNSNMVFRLLRTLSEEGWIVASDGGVKYSIGLRPFHHFSKPVKRMTLVKSARDPMFRMWQTTGESCYLGIKDGTHTLFLEHMDAVGDVRIVGRPGGTYLMHCAAPGKVLLAFSDDTFLKQVVKTEGLPAQTKHTFTKVVPLKKELAKVRQQGFALDIEEYAEGVICFAAPIFNHEGETLATIGISVLKLFYTPEEMIEKLGPEVLSAAKEISSTLGAQPEHMPKGWLTDK